MAPQQMTVLHMAGSSESEFYFECSLLYSKAACRFPDVKALYGILRPSDQTWFFFEDDISHLEKGDILSEKHGLSLSDFLKVVSKHSVNLVVPHMFDQPGMTTFRAFFQDVLGLPVVGPDSFANTVAQNKVYTRGVLMAMGVPMPKGYAVSRPDPNSHKVSEDWVESTDYKSLGFPLIMKPPLEDNSRGITLVKTREQLKGAFEECFWYGQQALLEEFIPGREFRCGAVDLPNSLESYQNKSTDESKGRAGGYPNVTNCDTKEILAEKSVAQQGLQVIPAMIEYVMTNEEMPIRTAADKLTTNEKGAMCQVKCVRKMPAEVDDELKARMGQITLQAHRALQCQDYSLFDFRVHAETNQPYVIECCAFWSFSPISAISLMLQASNLNFERMIADIWRMKAKESKMLGTPASIECGKKDDTAAISENGSTNSTTARSRSGSESASEGSR
jgi:D-alanine-D-alanine ligase